MQLDRTEIAIRQRTALELFDLSLIVLRRHVRKIMLTSALLGIPLLVADVLATAWMLGEDAYLLFEHLDNPQSAMQYRQAYHVVLLYFLQFPLISLPTTVFLGSQIFFEPFTLKSLFRRLYPISLRSLLVLGVFRMAVVALVVEAFVDRSVAWDWYVEFWLLSVVGLGVVGLRAGWPYAPEILALELCPLRRPRRGEMSFAQRSRSLHSLLRSDLVARFVGASIFALLLLSMLLAAAMFVQGVTTGDWMWNRWFNFLVLPTALWLVGLLLVVFRFLSYLDSRIRLEGWELELQLKAEAGRLTAKTTRPDGRLTHGEQKEPAIL